MKRIYIYFGVCFILLVYSLSRNTAYINKIKELEHKIKRLEERRLNKPLAPKVNQAHKDVPKPNQLIVKENNKENQLQNEHISHHPEKELESNKAPGIHSGMTSPAKMTLSSQTSIEPEKDLYKKIDSLIQRLKLNDAQKDEFWAIMIDYYDVYQQVKDSSSQLQQLKDQTMQRLTQILSSHQMKDFKTDHLIGR